jgi:deoxycytidylate deaminase
LQKKEGVQMKFVARRTEMRCQVGGSDKTYIIVIEDQGTPDSFVVYAMYGKTGRSSRISYKTHFPCSRDKATLIHSQVLSAKLRKGYQIVSDDSYIKLDEESNKLSERVKEYIQENPLPEPCWSW